MGKTITLISLLCLIWVPTTLGQSVQLRLAVIDSDTTSNGSVLVNVQAKVTDLSPSTLGSITLDVDYDSELLQYDGVIDSDINPGSQGYSYSADSLFGMPVSGNGSGSYVRLTIAGANVGSGFGKQGGFDLSTGFANLGTLEFKITDAGVAASALSMFVRLGSLSVGFFENQSNDPETGNIIEAAVSDIEDANNFALPVEGYAFEMDEEYHLGNPFPNPSSSAFRFTLAIRETQDVRVDLYNMVGQRVAVVYNDLLTSGELHRLSVDGAHLANGVYHLRVAGKAFTDTRSIVLVK